MLLGLGADYVFVGPTEWNEVERFRASNYFTAYYDQDEVTIFEMAQVLPSQPQATFDQGAIIFLGNFVDLDNPTQLVTAWELAQPTDKDYTLFIHLVDPQDKIVAQADHQLWAWDVKHEGPTSQWSATIPHLDVTTIPAEAMAQPDVSLRIGLWLPATGQQFAVESELLLVDQAGRLVLQ